MRVLLFSGGPQARPSEGAAGARAAGRRPALRLRVRLRVVVPDRVALHPPLAYPLLASGEVAYA